jgi:hypothetical protein
MSVVPPEADTPDALALNDFEVEASALAAEQGETARSGMLALLCRVFPNTRLWQRVLVWWAIGLSLLLALCIMVAQLETASPARMVPPATPSAPLRVDPLPAVLGAPPPYCLTAPTPRRVLPGISPVIGSAPFWVTGFDGPRATLHISTVDPVLATRYGWVTDVRWEVGPSFTGTLLVRGKNLGTGAPLWFRIPNQAATTLLLLDTRASHGASSLGSTWAEWLGEVYIRASGCYLLDVTWPGGHWQATFAAGRASQPVIPPGYYCRGQESPCVPAGIPPGPGEPRATVGYFVESESAQRPDACTPG